MSYNTVILLLGSNINNPEKNIETALLELEAKVGLILSKSKLILTKPVEFDSSNIFCNIATIIQTHLSPVQLLDYVKRIEVTMGRINDSTISKVYTDRIIDIDIVKFNELKFSSERLTIPHTRHLNEREFSKILLKDII